MPLLFPIIVSVFGSWYRSVNLESNLRSHQFSPKNERNLLFWASSFLRIVSFVRFLGKLEETILLSRFTDLYLCKVSHSNSTMAKKVNHNDLEWIQIKSFVLSQLKKDIFTLFQWHCLLSCFKIYFFHSFRLPLRIHLKNE